MECLHIQQNSRGACCRCAGVLLATRDPGAYNSLQFVSDDVKSQLPLAGSTEYDTSGSGVQDPASGGPRGPGSHDQIPPNKPPWFDQPHPVAPWGQQQVRNIVLKQGRRFRVIILAVEVTNPDSNSKLSHSELR